MFITFEGSDGSGKTTQISLLANHLRQQGVSVITTREPGGSPIGDQIRGVLHDVDNTALTAPAEILLYSASRAQLVEEVIRPGLAAGNVVLCDRYADSTMAYQGYGRGLDLDALAFITRFATGGLMPDLTFFLDIEIEAGLNRRKDGGEEINRMDLQTETFYRRVRQGYFRMIEAAPERWVVVDAARPVDAIQQEIRAIVGERLKVEKPGFCEKPGF